MRLNEIELVNFRSFERETIRFTDPRTLLAGPTGSGKSTIIDAIAWVLTGRCRGVDGRGVGQDLLIRDGLTETSVTLRLDGWPELTRTANATGVKANIKPDAIQQKLGVTDAALVVALYGGAFFTMHHSDAKKLIMRVLDVTIAPALVPGLNVTAPLDLDSLEMHYQDAFTRRAGAKKALDLHHVPEPPKVQEIEAGPVGDLTALRKVLADAKQQAQRARDAWVQTKTRLDQSRVELQRALGMASSVERIKASVAVHEDGIKEQRQRLQELGDAEQVRLSVTDADDKARLERMIESLSHHDPRRGCVLDAAIPCLTLAKDFTGKVKELRAQVDAIAQRAAAEHEENEARHKRNAQRSEIRRQIEMHESQRDRFVKQLEDAQVQQQNVTRLESSIKELEANELDQRKGEAETAAAQSQAERKADAAMRYHAATDGRETALAKRRDLEAEVQRLERLVELLGPSGVRVQVLQQAVKDFEDAINVALEAFGFKMFVRPDPWSVLIGRVVDHGLGPHVPDETVKPFVVYSGGEQVVIAMAFQQAMAMLTGLEFICVDAGETVTGDFRSTLTGLVMNSPLGQVIVAMGKAPTDPLPDFDGLQVVRLGASQAAGQPV